VALEVAALSHLALEGSVEPYAPAVHEAAGDADAAAVAARLRDLLGAARSRRVQDPFALRGLPQAHGPLRAAGRHASRVLTAEADAAAENPLVAADGVWHHGQFLTHRIASALEALRQAAYPAMSLVAARVRALVDPRLTGLPAFLAVGPAGSSGLMIVEYVVADVLARARAACAPRALAETTVSLGLEEQASFSSQAAGATAELALLLPDLLACELVCAVRALRLDPDRLRDTPARDLHTVAAARLPDVREDHVVGPELQVARDLLVERVADTPGVRRAIRTSPPGVLEHST
jgi:histidine ammonia-lyase